MALLEVRGPRAARRWPRTLAPARALQEGERVGAAVRTRAGVKPLFVSPGHRIGVSAA